ELQQFFDRFYVPNNATLIITGDFDLSQARQLARGYFGWIARGTDVAHSVAEPLHATARRVDISEPIAATTLLFGFPAPPYGSDDDAAMMIIERALEQRILHYVTLEENHLASGSFVRLQQFEKAGCFFFGVAMLPGADLRRAEQIANVRLQMFRDDGI